MDDTSTTSDVIRYTGLALEVLGVLLAAKGISDVRREWTGLPGIWATIKNCARHAAAWTRAKLADTWRRLRRRPRAVQLRGGLHAGVSTGASLTANVTRAKPPSAGTVEERLAWLERRLAFTMEYLDTTRTELGEERRAREAGDREERTAWSEAVSEARHALANFAGGGLHLQAWGVLAILAGTILATIPDELAKIG